VLGKDLAGYEEDLFAITFHERMMHCLGAGDFNGRT
jgi:hypothetical protein